MAHRSNASVDVRARHVQGLNAACPFTMGRPLSLMQLGALEGAVSRVFESSVDLVPDTVLRPEFREHVLAEAVAL